MAGALNRIFHEVADFNQTMAGLHNNFLSLLRRDIDRFEESTKNLNNQMTWEGRTTVALAFLSASFAITAALIPKAGPISNAPIDSRLNSSKGITDGFSNAMKWISEKFKDNDHLRSLFKTGSQFISKGLAPAADTFHRGKNLEIESKRKLLESVNLPDAQGKKSVFDQNVQQANQAVQRLFDSKSKSG